MGGRQWRSCDVAGAWRRGGRRGLCSSDTAGTRLHNPTCIISHKIKTSIFFFKFLHQVLHIHGSDAVSGVAIQAPQSHHRPSVLELKTSTSPNLAGLLSSSSTSRNPTSGLSTHAFAVALSTCRSPRHAASGPLDRPFFLCRHDQSEPSRPHHTNTRGVLLVHSTLPRTSRSREVCSTRLSSHSRTGTRLSTGR